MTDKRFTDVWCSETGHIGVTDNGIDKEFTGSEFEEWLNHLHEENNNLKQALWDAEVNYYGERCDNILDYESWIEDLKKEWNREYWND